MSDSTTFKTKMRRSTKYWVGALVLLMALAATAAILFA